MYTEGKYNTTRSVMFVEYDKMLYFVIKDNYILIPILKDV